MNTNKLTDNIIKQNNGELVAVRPVEDLQYKKSYDTNSWFAIGHFEAEGEKLNFLYHLMVMKIKGIRMMVSCFTITNETTGWYAGEDKAYPLFRCKIGKDEFNIKTPTGYMRGDLDNLTMGAKMKGASVEMTMKGIGYPLYNKDTGNFDMMDMNIYQYSLPTMETEGKVTIEGKEYKVEGISWFDRQWQNQDEIIEGKWSWMDLNLSNGDRISLWDTIDKNNNNESWVTILHEDGTQTVAEMEHLASTTTDYWVSEKSGAKYPGKWMIKIPKLNAELEVIPVIRDQEIAGMKGFAHYEGASTVSGMYNGEQVTGYCYIELVGDWTSGKY